MKDVSEVPQPVARWRYAAELVLLSAAYFGAARLALAFAIPPGYATPVWPSSGIALAALLLLGLRAWPGVWIGAALVNFTVNASLPLALLIATGNTLEALVGAALVGRYVGIPYRFERSAEVVKFVAAAILAGAVAASVAVVPLALSHALEGAALYANWWTWWQGDVAGMILVAPLILSWCGRGSVTWTRPKILEAAAFCLLLALAAALIFGGDSAFFDFYPMKFGLVLFVIWAAYRFSQREVTTAVAAIAVVALWDAVGGIGTSWPWLNESLLVLLAFNVTLAITGLVLCAVAQERAAAMEALERARLQLETRVRERTAEIERANQALATDIARRVEAEEQLRAVVDTAADAIVSANEDGVIISFNAAAERIFGYAVSEACGKPLTLLMPERFQAAHRQGLRRFLDTGESSLTGRTIELTASRRGGAEFPIEISIAGWRTSTGRFFTGILRDVTRRHAAAEALRASEERFRQMVANVVDYAILMLDPEGRVIGWNAGAERIMGYRADEIIGRHYSRFYQPEDRERGKPQRMLELAAAEGRHQEEALHVRRNGSTFWANVVITRMLDPEGKLIGYSKVTRDLTERKRAEAVLVQARATAGRANAEKSMFLAKMSHEFRTPLNSLMILAQLLADNAGGNLTQKQVEYARTIFGAGSDLAVLVSDILQAARDEWTQSGASFSLAPERVANLSAYCGRTFRPVAAGKGLEFSITVGSDVPPTLYTAAHRLRQILNNLLANAFRCTDAGGVTLRIERAYAGWSAGHGQLDTAPGVIAFSVTDTGIGFAPEFRAVMFEEFRREGHQPGSTGLGLAISRQLTDLLGGEITAASTPGNGSTFTVYLPLFEAPTPAAIGRGRQPGEGASRMPDNGASL